MASRSLPRALLEAHSCKCQTEAAFVGIVPTQPSSRTSVLLRSSTTGVAVVTCLANTGLRSGGTFQGPVITVCPRAGLIVVPPGPAPRGHEFSFVRAIAEALSHGAPRGVAAQPPQPARPGHPERGTPSSPPGTGVPFHSMKESTVSTVASTRSLRPVGVLLGGSGCARPPVQPTPRVAVLFKLMPTAVPPSCETAESRGEVAASC